VTKLSTALPAELAAALAGLMENQSRKELQDRARRISAGFRARKSTLETVRDETDALAYALTRLPATYAATATVLGRLSEEAGDFAPKRILDLGCGLGAASFAALEIWPKIESAVLLDRSREFLTLARRLTKTSGHAALASAEMVEADIARPPPEPMPFDLVIVSYALTELPDDALTTVINDIWRRVGGALALIEPGTPRDYQRLMAARTRLAALGARILSPCPHERPCPLPAPDWCHFSTRLPRSRDHKLLKNADAPFEDEKFSYLVVSRDGLGRDKDAARIIAPPRVLKHGIDLKLCDKNGIGETTMAKRDKPRYDRIRKSVWGDSIDIPAEDTE
jgi:ribosomal protein RSM22 (predicted rRNA methylase)